MNIQMLQKKLEKAKVPYENWGKGITKSLATLLSEVSEKTSRIKFPKNGAVLRLPLKVKIDVFWYAEGGVLMHLKEVHQIMPNGYVRERSPYVSVSEKHPKSENTLSAAVRGLSEELSIKINRRHLIKTARYVSEQKPSDVYPGIDTQSTVTQYVYFMRKKLWKPFYTEVKNGRTTFFIWRPYTG